VIKIAQCDLWFPPIELPVGFGQVRKPAQLPVLTMVLGYSRWLLAMLVPSRRAEDLFAGWWRLIERLGAVPRVLVGTAKAPIGRWRDGPSELTGECQAFRDTLGAKVVVCRPADREAKGITTTASRSYTTSRRSTSGSALP
jgi:transposase